MLYLWVAGHERLSNARPGQRGLPACLFLNAPPRFRCSGDLGQRGYELCGGGIAEGRVEFVLPGKKLKGGFVLAKMSGTVKERFLI